MQLLKQLEELTGLLEIGCEESYVYNKLFKILYNNHKGNTLSIFLQFKELDDERLKKERYILKRGMQDAIHHMSNLIQNVENPKKSKGYIKEWFNSDNIAYMIGTMQAYFPKGIAEGQSQSSRYVFDLFVKQLLTHKDKYLEGGSSFMWANDMEFTDYINLILENNKL